MATTPTHLPVPSENPHDLKFNAGKIDEFVTSLVNTYVDRFGNAHYTIEGLKQLVLQQIYNLGWTPIGTFQGGAVINAAGDVIQDETNNVWYRWDDLSTIPKVVAPGSTPDSSGGIGNGKWIAVDISDVLRKQLSDPNGAITHPEFQMARWRDEGDVRGWGAKCDNQNDDTLAVRAAVAATGGKIVIPGNVFVAGIIAFTGLTSPRVQFLNGAKLRIDTTFQFNARHRAPLSFYQCSNPTVIDAHIIGAKVDKIGFSGVDPIQDGDAGIEYLNCTGVCSTIRPIIFDVKTWGVIHVNVEGYVVSDGYIENCQVQSGIGCTGSQWAMIRNMRIKYAGLYGIELETVGSNLLTQIIGGLVSNSRNAVNIVNNSKNISIDGLHAINCIYGVGAEGPVYSPTNITLNDCIATSCRNGYLLNNIAGLDMKGCKTDRDDTEFFARTNALDRVFTFNADTATAAYPAAPNTLAVGDLIEFDNGVQRTVATVGTSTDAIFGNMRTFTTTTALTPDCLRRSFRRYTEVVNTKRGVVMIGGSGYRINGCTFSQDTDLIYSTGDHANLMWKNNFATGIARYFTQATGGTVTGSIEINPSDCNNVGPWNQPNKFIPAFNTVRSYTFNGGNNTDTKRLNAIAIEDGIIGGARCAINSGYTTTGTPAVKLNGTDIISGGFSGSPARANAILTAPLAVNGAATIQLVDTVGDIVASGYSVQLRGVFK